MYIVFLFLFLQSLYKFVVTQPTFANKVKIVGSHVQIVSKMPPRSGRNSIALIRWRLDCWFAEHYKDGLGLELCKRTALGLYEKAMTINEVLLGPRDLDTAYIHFLVDLVDSQI